LMFQIRARGRSRCRVYPRFAATQKEYDLLVRIKDYFGFGGINYTDQPTGRIWKWTVSNKHDVKSLFRSYFNSTREYVRIGR